MNDVNAQDIVNERPPATLREAIANWPTRPYHPSPSDWRDQVLYFLLPDRFSNGKERPDRLLTADLSTTKGIAKIRRIRGADWRWDKWLESGRNRFQGGTLSGVRSKLEYLHELGVTTLWIGPVFKQRAEENSYHGYDVESFLEVDSRFGTRKDLIQLVDEAHEKGMYVILDLVFKPTGDRALLDAGGDPNVALIYQYWIALTDIDGVRVDTAHVTLANARSFCNALREYAEVLEKDRFLVVGEAGGDSNRNQYVDIFGRNLDACLDIGAQREWLCSVSQGLLHPLAYFSFFSNWDEGFGSHRNFGARHLSILNDHDHLFGPKIRYAADAANNHQGAAGVALQLFTLGIPCLYYGIEQGLASGAEDEERTYLPWNQSDTLLRETMFGPEHPLGSGWAGIQNQADEAYPGFGPHGTSGYHVFNTKHPIYRRISEMTKVRAAFKALRRGRQYLRKTSYLDYPFDYHGPGQLLAWSRVYDEQELLVVLNTHGAESRGARIEVDAKLSQSAMIIVMNTDPAVPASMRAGHLLEVETCSGLRYVFIESLGPSEVMVLANPEAVDAEQTTRFSGVV